MEAKTEFTKGEWESNYGTVSCGDIRVADCELNNMAYTPTEIANAHLIAAAPEMYAMLQKVCEFHPHLCCIKDIEKLLAKARGQ